MKESKFQLKKRKKRTPYRVIQKHHISYKPVKTCLMFRSEHSIITNLNRLLKSKPSEDFLSCLATCIIELAMADQYSPRAMSILKLNNQKLRKQRRQK